MKRFLLLALSIMSSTIQADELTVRIATFNIEELSWEKLERVDADGNGTDPQLVAAARIIQQVRPDVLLINEIDYTDVDESHDKVHTDQNAIERFRSDTWNIPMRVLKPRPTRISIIVRRTPECPRVTTLITTENRRGRGRLGIWPLPQDSTEWRSSVAFQSTLRRPELFASCFGSRCQTATCRMDSMATSVYSQDEQAVFRLSSKSHGMFPCRSPGDRSTCFVLTQHPRS